MLRVMKKHLTDPGLVCFVQPVPSSEKGLELLAPVIWDHWVVSATFDRP